MKNHIDTNAWVGGTHWLAYCGEWIHASVNPLDLPTRYPTDCLACDKAKDRFMRLSPDSVELAG